MTSVLVTKSGKVWPLNWRFYYLKVAKTWRYWRKIFDNQKVIFITMIDQNSAVLEVRVSNCRSKSFAKSWLDYFFSKEQKKRFCGSKKCNETEVKNFEQKKNATILNHIKHKNLTVRANPIFDPVFTLIDIWGLDFNQDSTCKLGFNPKIGIQPEYWDSTQRLGFISNIGFDLAPWILIKDLS